MDIENKENSKKILIIGTMSSGKSTFINSILKENILPTSNLACTSKEIKITISNKKKNFSYYLGNRMRSLKNDGFSKINFLNTSSNILNIEIKGPSLIEKMDGYEIYDSPGPNNSINIEHKEISIGIFKNKKFEKVIYVFNAGNLFTTDDKILLEEIMKKGYGTIKPLIVVVNKIDKIHISEESTDDEIKSSVDKFLKMLGITNYKTFLYSSIYFSLGKQKNKTKSEKRLFLLLKEIYGSKKIRELKKIRKEIFL